jgi:hypothetical protein
MSQMTDNGNNQWALGGTNDSDDDERVLTTSDGDGKVWASSSRRILTLVSFFCAYFCMQYTLMFFIDVYIGTPS